MLRYIFGVSLIAISIIVIRALTYGKIQKKQQYALWLAIPLYMLIAPFLKINVPVSDQLSFLRLENNPVVIESEVYGGEKPSAVVNHAIPDVSYKEQTVYQETGVVENTASEKQVVQKEETARPPVDWVALIKCGSLVVSALFIAGIAVYNAGFISYCRRRRKYVGRDPLSGLKIYSIGHKGTPFLLIKNIYVDKDSDRLSKYVICHEACHHKHGDSVWVILRYLVLALNWYNPVIWAAFILSDRDCELACDEEVLNVYGIGASKEYAMTLFGLMQKRSDLSFGFTVSTGMKGDYRMMKRRIESIKSPAKKKNKYLALSLAAVIIFSGCSIMNPTSAGSKDLTAGEKQAVSTEPTAEQTTVNEEFSYNDSPSHIQKSIDYNGATISIDADIEQVSGKDLKTVTLAYDESIQDKIYNNWIVTNYPDSSARPQVNSDIGCLLGFADLNKDINGSTVDDGRFLMEKGYVTDKTPMGMSIDATAAANDAISFIRNYSPFEYSIFNVVAVNDAKKNIGYYDIALQAEYGDTPVESVHGILPRTDVADEAEGRRRCSVGFSAAISKDGMFSFQGIFAMKAADTKPVGNIVPFENIADKCLENLKAELPADGNYGPNLVVTDKKIEITKVYLAYIPEYAPSDPSKIILTPAWCCECRNSSVDNGEETVVVFKMAYSVETGELLSFYW